jgi:hypothetical protein
MQNKTLLTLPRFRRWLNGFKDDQEVGIATKHHRCPIAAYLKSQSDKTMYGDEPSGYVNAFEYHAHNTNRRRLPAWARRFVQALDRNGPRTVTAKEVREILNKVDNKGN